MNMAGKYTNDHVAYKDVSTTDFRMLFKMGDASAGVCSYCGKHGPVGWYCCGNNVFETRMMAKAKLR